ncbi:MAG: bifunctional diguanylate cyclase/phosphodiesterase [Pseudomonadota bacterium]
MIDRRFSISHWVAAFFIVLSVIIAMLCGIGLYRLYETGAELERSRQRAAQQELADAISDLAAFLQQQSSIIANWDEVRQQLAEPNFYGYWKASRVQQSGQVSPLFGSFDLYDSSGRLLPGGNPDSAVQLRPDEANKTVFYPDQGLSRIVHAFPIYAGDGQSLLGYGRVSFDFVKAMQAVRSFSYLMPESLTLTSFSPSPVPLQELGRLLNYEISTANEVKMLEEAVTKTYTILAFAMLIAAITAYLFIQRLLARPLAELASAIGELQADEAQMNYVEELESPYMLKELDTVRQSIQDYRQKLSNARLELENRNVVFQQQALQDSLTGLYNRRAFDEDWENLVRALAGESEPLALLLFDCDHFKPINDTYGHHVGDLVLQTIAGAVNEVMRSGDRLYRIGGDEFATLLWGADEHMALQIAERCLNSVRRQDFRQFGMLEPVSISIGMAIDEISKLEDLTRLQAHADAAMYQAKRPGNKKIAIYRHGQSNEDALVANLEINALYQALSTPDKMEIHYQRMMPLAGGREYLEALARIHHHDLLIMPDRFLPVVHGRKLEAEFDLVVIRHIQSDLKSGVVPLETGVSINLSAQSLHHPEIITQLIEMTHHTDRHPLILEITETSLVPQLAEITHFLGILRSGGFKIALDDFGSGYSPLRYLADLPVDIIKFDMGLIHQLNGNDRTSMVVADFARLMRDAGYELIAEGVEDEAMLRKVVSLGFAHAQGFYIDRPHALAPGEAKVAKLFR